MTPENIDRFADKLSVDQSTIKKLRLNSATAQELSAHPYITFALASKLVTSRESQGNFLSRDDLKKRGLVSRELSLKLAPYLQFD